MYLFFFLKFFSLKFYPHALYVSKSEISPDVYFSNLFLFY